MKKRTRHFKARYIIFAFFGVALLALLVFMRFGGFGTGKTVNVEEFVEYAQPVENLSIPEGKKIIALGEATHGNVEFQRTDDMVELISYMREYNESALEGEDIRFYGFDMQRISYTFQYLMEACTEFKIDTTSLQKFVEGEKLNSVYDFSTQIEILTQVKNELENNGASNKIIHYVDMLLQYCELESITESDGGALRDKFMAENVQWILQQEQQNNYDRIFVAGHNSHVAKWGSYDSMGKILSKEVENGYYVIGTDFYRTRCNMPTRSSAKRTNQVFYSHDPLAKAAKLSGYDICWLNFEKVQGNSELGRQISEYTYMGTLGESYLMIMRLLPPSYRMFQPPAVLYDSMIFVSDANPIKIISEE